MFIPCLSHVYPNSKLYHSVSNFYSPRSPMASHLLHSCRGMPRGANFQGLRQNSSVAPTHHQGAANSTLGRKRVASDLKCWSLATRLKQYGNVKKHSINGSMEFHLCWFLLWNCPKHIETYWNIYMKDIWIRVHFWISSCRHSLCCRDTGWESLHATHGCPWGWPCLGVRWANFFTAMWHPEKRKTLW